MFKYSYLNINILIFNIHIKILSLLKVADVWAAKLPFPTMRQTCFNHLVVGQLSVMDPAEATNHDWLLR